MLPPWKKSYDKPKQCIKKQKSYDKPKQCIALPAKVHLVKAMVFPVVMYACESYTIKITECQRIDAFLNCGI